MNKIAIQGIVLVLMLVALPLTSIGTTTDATWVAIAGLIAIAAAGIVPPALRFADKGGDDK